MTTPGMYVPSDVLLRLERMTLASKRRIRGTMQGKRRSKQLGSSLEFADYREYAPGDDIRRFDWSVYGRTGKPFIKQYMDEQELFVHLVVDASASMNFGIENGALSEGGQTGNKFDYAKRLAACIGYIALASYDRVDAACFMAGSVDRTPPLRGRGSADRLFRFLAQTPAEPGNAKRAAGSTSDRSGFMQLLSRLSAMTRGPGVTWVFSDFLADYGVEEALSYLIAAKQEVVVVQVLSRQELSPDLFGDLRLVDSESASGKEVAVSSRVLRAYQAELQAYTDRLRGFCHERGLTYVLVPSDLPVGEAAMQLFKQAGAIE